jgi:hypothetical protein
MNEPPFAPFRSTGAAEPPPSFPDTPLARVQDGARDLRTIVALAGTLANGGRRLDLTGLDGQIGAICAKMLDLPPDEGRLASPELQALLAELDRLCETMRISSAPPA